MRYLRLLLLAIPIFSAFTFADSAQKIRKYSDWELCWWFGKDDACYSLSSKVEIINFNLAIHKNDVYRMWTNLWEWDYVEYGDYLLHWSTVYYQNSPTEISSEWFHGTSTWWSKNNEWIYIWKTLLLKWEYQKMVVRNQFLASIDNIIVTSDGDVLPWDWEKLAPRSPSLPFWLGNYWDLTDWFYKYEMDVIDFWTIEAWVAFNWINIDLWENIKNLLDEFMNSKLDTSSFVARKKLIAKIDTILVMPYKTSYKRFIDTLSEDEMKIQFMLLYIKEQLE